MSNYPPGMTAWDWKHIDGETHHRECPMSEDNLMHRCPDIGKDMPVPEWMGKWVLPIQVLPHSWKDVPISFCPYCGWELEVPDCACGLIAEDAAAEAAERRML